MTAFTLPRIDARIPQAILPALMIQSRSALPQYLMEAEALSEADIPLSWECSFDACQDAMKSWIQREIGELHCLEPSFHLGLSHAEENVPFCDGSVFVEWRDDGKYQWAVGEKLEALNTLLPGLGAIVLHVLCRQSAPAYPLFVPDVALDTASFLYWYGYEDEELVIDDVCGDDEEERENMRESMVTLADFKAVVPVWALNWPRGLTLEYCSRYLRRSLRKLTDPAARQIAADALSLSLLQFETSYAEDFEGNYVGFGAVLSWAENDVTVRVYDDLCELAGQSEYCELIGEVELSPTEPKQFSEWQQDMRPRFEAIRLIDRLIHALSM
ncbi:MAG: PRTRC system protein F [Betaproteobacteria bacterium]|nr:PRTRC system protein F [Betaproteobacteria bacterium]